MRGKCKDWKIHWGRLMDKPIYNNTDDLIWLCKDEDIGKAAIEALELTRAVIKKANGVKVVTEAMYNKYVREHLPLYTIFRYFNDITHEDIDKAWVDGIYRLTNLNYKEVKNVIINFLPPTAQNLSVNQAQARALRRDLGILIHCLWATKKALLPLRYGGLPEYNSGSNKSYEFAFDAYPELLKLVRAPFNESLSDTSDLTKHMPATSLKNFNWYAYRFVRSCAAWDVEDITPELLSEMSSDKRKIAPRTIDWYLALIDVFPNRVNFTKGDLYAIDIGGLFGGSKKKSNPELSFKYIAPSVLEENPNINNWVEEGTEYVKLLANKGIKSYYTHTLAIGKVLKGFIAHETPVPSLHELNRKEHLAIIKDALRKNVSDENANAQMYKIEEFFDYLEKMYPGSFVNLISRKLDYKVTKRRQKTAKKIVAEGTFASFLSYLYGVAEWLWYINEVYAEKTPYINKFNNRDKILNPAESGFQPLFIVDGKYYPIKEIPRKNLSTSYSTGSPTSQLVETTVMPHFVHLAIVMAETGIRQMHLRWLDKDLYDKDVDRLGFNERAYVPTKLWVNTDKSHGPWQADVSESVMGILDRQKLWRSKYLRGKDTPVPYDGFENSEFDDIRPLFAAATSGASYNDVFSTCNDATYRIQYRHFFAAFSWTFAQVGESPPIDVSSFESLEDLVATLPIAVGTSIMDGHTPHGMRSQIVSDNITILPPSVIQRITGHSNPAHIMYYAQVNEGYLEHQQAAHNREFKGFIAPMMIDAKSKDSRLNHAMKKDPLNALQDFGGVSFGNDKKSGLKQIKESLKGKKSIDEIIAFNSTHMCPFNNECPPDAVNKELEGFKTCGACPYSIKTCDHMSAIGGKIRSFSDKAAELDKTIREAKDAEDDMENYQGEIALKKHYVNEIAAWAISVNVLEHMAETLKHRDTWLVDKPEFITKELQGFEASNELTNLLVRIEEAQGHQEFMTPQLKAKVMQFRNKVLVKTGQFQQLMNETSSSTALMAEFKGIIKSVCDITGIGVNELPQALEKQTNELAPALRGSVGLVELKKEVEHG